MSKRLLVRGALYEYRAGFVSVALRYVQNRSYLS